MTTKNVMEALNLLKGLGRDIRPNRGNLEFGEKYNKYDALIQGCINVVYVAKEYGKKLFPSEVLLLQGALRQVQPNNLLWFEWSRKSIQELSLELEETM